MSDFFGCGSELETFDADTFICFSALKTSRLAESYNRDFDLTRSATFW